MDELAVVDEGKNEVRDTRLNGAGSSVEDGEPQYSRGGSIWIPQYMG